MTLKTDPYIAMVAGEPSGDLIASRVIHGIRAVAHESSFRGIGGPNMSAEGMQLLYPMDALTIFGYVDALKSLPTLIRTYKGLERLLLADKPDVFVGVDAPDFNLRLEHQLKSRGIPTVHFVGPSIWAWRYERIHKIREAVSHMLVLFPFETEIYQKEGIPVTCVGHPLAEQIPMQPDPQVARQRLGLDPDGQYLAILPGSRLSELKLLSEPFLKAAQLLAQHNPQLQFMVPIVNQKCRDLFNQMAQHLHVPNIHVFDKKYSDRPISWDVLQACDAALVASGTATLETALFKRPMVISYILSPLVRKIMEYKSGQKSAYVPWIGLPNVLLQEFAVPEILQDEVNPQSLAQACIRALEDKPYIAELKQKFTHMHESLSLDTAAQVASVVLQIAQRSA